MKHHERPALRGAVAPGTTAWHWTVIDEAPRRHRHLRHLLCRCVCGTEREVFIHALRVGLSKSCGCQSKAKKHGLSATPEHQVWRTMKHRCHNPNSDAFHNYGGRGIQVCQRWRDSFEDFIADVGRRPDPKMTLDRINNDGHYEPGNVRWATRAEQMQNTRLTHADRVRTGREKAMKRWHPDSQHL